MDLIKQQATVDSVLPPAKDGLPLPFAEPLVEAAISQTRRAHWPTLEQALLNVGARPARGRDCRFDSRRAQSARGHFAVLPGRYRGMLGGGGRGLPGRTDHHDKEASRQVPARNVYSPDVLKDPYVRNQQRRVVEALQRQCLHYGERCIEAAQARQWFSEQEAAD